MKRQPLPLGKSFAMILVIIAVVFMVLAVVLGVLFVQTRSKKTSPEIPSNTNNEVPLIQNTNIQTAPPIVDEDLDGLSDTEEQAAGTNLKQADTDEDGLSDREEVQTFGTQPLQPDTDRDGFSDGDEIRNGYNPNGPGQLFDFEQGFKNLNQS